MPAGVEILGGTSITQDSRVMQMVHKVHSSATTMTTSGSGIYQRRTYQYTIPYVNCITAVSQVSGSVTPVILSSGSPVVEGTPITVSCYGGATPPVFEVFAFREGGGGPVSNGAGIEIYRANSLLGFGSGYKPMRPLSQFEWRLDQSGDPGVNFNPADYAETHSGKRVACVFSRHARALDGDGTLANMTVPASTVHFVNTQSTGDCRLTWIVSGNAGKDIPYWERKGRYMFLDVTNF